MLRPCILSLLLVLSVATFAAQSPVEEQWQDFLAKPSASTYEPLSKSIQSCVITKCHADDVAGSKDNFASLHKLLKLTQGGNHYAMEITFEIRPLYVNAAAPSEYIDKSVGMSATLEPEFFLELIQKFHIQNEMLEQFVVQTSDAAIDSLPEHRKEWKSRILSLSKVNDPRLLPLRNKAISLIQSEIDKYSKLPDDALGD
jgi:hypothetical protein